MKFWGKEKKKITGSIKKITRIPFPIILYPVYSDQKKLKKKRFS